MNDSKKTEKMYMVFGYMDTGSGSLTFPEDFDFVGVYKDKEIAEAHARRLNEENGVNDDPDSDDYDDECTDEMRYDVWDLEVLSSKKEVTPKKR